MINQNITHFDVLHTIIALHHRKPNVCVKVFSTSFMWAIEIKLVTTSANIFHIVEGYNLLTSVVVESNQRLLCFVPPSLLHQIRPIPSSGRNPTPRARVNLEIHVSVKESLLRICGRKDSRLKGSFEACVLYAHTMFTPASMNTLTSGLTSFDQFLTGLTAKTVYRCDRTGSMAGSQSNRLNLPVRSDF
ncbi:pentatricopeptide repeat-containing protein at1g62670 mitochondrial [Phtheirospermum japonicum]|uniref:Pentatricopeptide repeat-containing protein at1g62670 mitochondrial n=1 Tax=Phtheirospermum japonicum TaxID=374723 RepID=A0A830CN27_9LAMI|nr:pentatricopeptide repeat-containing protein at1g62670 mitochondrial [Phtheirospermum japonicum]